MNRKLNRLKQQSGAVGVALLTAIMVVALVVTIATRESWRSKLDLTRHSHRWMGMQAKAYAEGAEQLAKIALDKDFTEAPQIDSLGELWAERFEFPTDHGYMAVKIIDAQSKINVNALGEAYQRPAGKNKRAYTDYRKYSAEQKRFIRLLQTVPIEEDQFIDPSEAEAILEAVKDWVDADNDVSGYNGAEADFYAQEDPPVTPANGPMLSVSELRQIRGMPPVIYQGILPYVAALDANAGLNVNTLNVVVARALNSEDNLLPLAPLDAESLVTEIAGEQPEDKNTMLNMPIIDPIFGVKANGQSLFETDGLTFTTQNFYVNTTVLVGDNIHRASSMIVRTNGESKIVRRSDANF